LYQPPPCPRPPFTIRPETLHPGVTPPRFAGRPPKCFFALFQAFLGVTLAGEPAEPQFVHQKLRENPAFARTCGFTLPRAEKLERASDLPSLRKLQQFDQIMTQNGLWGEAALDRVAANLRAGTVQVEATVVHDTTHYHASSAMQVLDLAAELAGGDGISEPVTGDATAAVADPSQERRAGGPAELAAKTPEPAPSSAPSPPPAASVAANTASSVAAYHRSSSRRSTIFDPTDCHVRRASTSRPGTRLVRRRVAVAPVPREETGRNDENLLGLRHRQDGSRQQACWLRRSIADGDPTVRDMWWPKLATDGVRTTGTSHKRASLHGDIPPTRPHSGSAGRISSASARERQPIVH